MKDKDKLILLFNLQIGGMGDVDVKNYIDAVAKNFSGFFDDSVKCIFAPTRDEAKPAVQAVTDFPWEGVELVLQMEKYIKENDFKELKSHAQAVCEYVKEYQKVKENE